MFQVVKCFCRYASSGCLLIVLLGIGGCVVAEVPGCNAEAAIATEPKVNGWGIDVLNQRFVPTTRAGIDKANLEQLALRWAFAYPDSDAPRAQAFASDNIVVVADMNGGVYALDREMGCERWRYDAGSMVRSAIRYIEVDGQHLLTFGTLAAEIIAIDLLSGDEVWRLQAGEHPQAMVSGSGVEYDGVLYQAVSSFEVFTALNPFYACCTFRSSILAIDAGSGEIIWRAYTIEEKPAVYRERVLLPDLYGPSGAPVWSQPTLDIERQRLYVGTGENYSSPATDTSDAILAFDMNTGEMLWKQQFLASDAWNVSCESPLDANCPDEKGMDLDFGAPPILVEVQGRDYILAGQKNGAVYALDPDRDGELFWSAKPGTGGKAGGVHFAMAVDPVSGVLFVPISDRDVGLFGANPPGEPNPSLHAFDIATGESLWEAKAPGTCTDERGRKIKKCYPGFSAAVTATEELVFAPALDGILYVYDTATGELLWTFNTLREFPAVNETETGGPAKGGAIDGGGVYLDAGTLFMISGYGMVGQIPGNAFLVLTPSKTRAGVSEE